MVRYSNKRTYNRLGYGHASDRDTFAFVAYVGFGRVLGANFDDFADEVKGRFLFDSVLVVAGERSAEGVY